MVDYILYERNEKHGVAFHSAHIHLYVKGCSLMVLDFGHFPARIFRSEIIKILQ